MRARRFVPALVVAGTLSYSAATAHAATVTVTVDDAVIAKASRVGIGVNGGGGWYTLVGANLVDDPCFEGQANADGVSSWGWPWGFAGGGSATASLDTTTFASGKQSQKLVVTSAPVTFQQGRVDLPQAPLVLQVTAAGSYVIKARIKSDTAGAQVKLGIMVGGWSSTFGPATSVTTSFQEYSWTYVPTTTAGLVGFSIELLGVATYWVDDFLAWNANDIDPATGLSAIYVSRLKELEPSTLRLGGLGVNGIPLASYLFEPYPLTYGPPPLAPEMGINTFLKLCKAVGADPFITIPPAFSDATHAALGDLTDDVVDNYDADHGNFIDYLGGDAATTYGARREADGYSRWDLQFGSIYFELGNEIWGTPDGKWDMDVTGSDTLVVQQERLARYDVKRMTDMKARPGWRANMRVGFGGRDPNIWIGNWAGSYNTTVVPPLKDLTDFSTIGMYYGPGSSTSDDVLYGDLFAHAQWLERETKNLKAAFYTAAGNKPIETTVYEGAAVWGPYAAYLDTTVYAKEVSLGAAVSLIDSFAGGNKAGVTVNNLFHFNGNVWATVSAYPECYRKPTYLATKLFTHYLTGDLVTCTTQNDPTYNGTTESSVPTIACYAYKDGLTYDLLLVNRDRAQPHDVLVDKPLIPVELVKLTASDINANNETGESVTLATQALGTGAANQTTLTVPPFSAVVLVAHPTSWTPPDDGAPSASDSGAPTDAARPGGDGGASASDATGGSAPLASALVGGGCACTSGASPALGLAWLLWAAIATGRVRRRSA